MSGLASVFNSFGFNGTLYRIVSNSEMEEQGDGSLDVQGKGSAAFTAAALSVVAFFGFLGDGKVGFPINVVVVLVRVPESL